MKPLSSERRYVMTIMKKILKHLKLQYLH